VSDVFYLINDLFAGGSASQSTKLGDADAGGPPPA